MTHNPIPNLLTSTGRREPFAVPSGWSYGITVVAAWADLDKLGHVTNTTFWKWCDDVRVQYVIDMGLSEPSRDTPSVVVARAAGEFHAAMAYRQTGMMTCRTTRLGRSSMDTEHALWLETGKAFSATFTLVMTDQLSGCSMLLPIEFKNRISALEGL